MELPQVLTYTRLKSLLAQALGRQEIPTSTLSRWMSRLGYPKGQPGRRRFWDGEDLCFIGSYAQAVSWGYTDDEARKYAKNQIEKLRSKTHAGD